MQYRFRYWNHYRVSKIDSVLMTQSSSSLNMTARNIKVTYVILTIFFSTILDIVPQESF